jgi:hypothetical protein
MDSSVSSSVTLSCPRCGTQWEADVWVVVDETERPDLVKRIREHTLHGANCPYCDQSKEISAPLLVFRF